MLPPLQDMPPALSTVTGVVPSSVPPEIVSVPGCQGPAPTRFTVHPETMTALPLTVVGPLKVAVPPLKVQVPPRFKAAPVVNVAPVATVRLPAPEIVALLLMV